MTSFFDEIIPNHTLMNMRALGDHIDYFGGAIKQILNFEFLLYDSLNDLASRFVDLRTEVSQMSTQLVNVDDAVQAYFRKNDVHITTKDGLSLDDAVAELKDSIEQIYRRLEKQGLRTDKLEAETEKMVQKDDWKLLVENVNKYSSMAEEGMHGVQRLQEQLNDQTSNIDGKWDIIKSMFKSQTDEFQAVLDRKPSLADLEKYCRHKDLAELCTLLSSLTAEKRTRIKEIIPQVFLDSAMTMEEKLQAAYKLLTIERERLDLEDAELVEEFEQLKNLIKMQNSDEIRDPKFKEVTVTDIGTVNGFVETSEPRSLVFNRGVSHRSVQAQFQGPDNCEADNDVELDELVSAYLVKQRTGNAQGMILSDEFKSDIVKSCTDAIEEQLAPLFGASGAPVDKEDIHVLIGELKEVSEFKTALEALKVKLNLKVDQSFLMQELEKCLKREEFFEMMECPATGTRTGSRRGFNSALRVRKTNDRSNTATPPTSGRRQKPEVQKPVTLVPARNSKLLSVNEKYLIGDDGKTYLKESSRISDRQYREPPITGDRSHASYYDRSKISMEIEGVDAVLDFQPFVPRPTTS